MSRPKCPNHTVEMDKTDNPRIWICPVSGYRFECEVETNSKEVKLDKFGRVMTEWKLNPLDGQGG